MARPVILLNGDVESEGLHATLRIRLPAAYVDAVAAAGGLPVVVSPTLPLELLREHVARCDGVLFIGGADYPPAWYGEAALAETKELHPVRAAADRELARAVLACDKPVLAICGGHQLLNLACGGKLIQHLPQAAAHVGNQRHGVTIRSGRRLRKIFGEGRIEVNSWHHQAADPQAIGQGLVVTARADDGTIEALEGMDPGRFLLGVQWHPERHADPEHRRKLFEAFVAAAAGMVLRRPPN
ncbi:MAG: gamma-glutamyl-gamma-aminobutyrate hydrolase family protein [Kiritimatiellia bacterium]